MKKKYKKLLAVHTSCEESYLHKISGKVLSSYPSYYSEYPILNNKPINLHLLDLDSSMKLGQVGYQLIKKGVVTVQEHDLGLTHKIIASTDKSLECLGINPEDLNSHYPSVGGNLSNINKSRDFLYVEGTINNDNIWKAKRKVSTGEVKVASNDDSYWLDTKELFKIVRPGIPYIDWLKENYTLKRK